MLKVKTSTLVLIAVALTVTYLFAAPVVISRITSGIMVQGGTTTTNGKTVIVADSSTNEFTFVTDTATVAGAATAYTNTFTTPFLASPAILLTRKSGGASTDSGTATFTVTSSNIIVSGLNSAGTTNNLGFILYGYKRTGKFE